MGHQPIGLISPSTTAQLFGNTRTTRLQQFLKPWFDRSLPLSSGTSADTALQTSAPVSGATTGKAA